MKNKELFVSQMKDRTKKFAVDVIKFCDSLIACKASSVITYQLVKAATSTGANYRAACVSRSEKEFYSKMCIVVEEIDESEYWLSIIVEADLSNDEPILLRLFKEASEISKIMTKSRTTVYKRINNKNF
ncbi:MAG: four helix bundle protein [Bacteroidetes bacterium]|nr:MAG: four helix bundle protein [Bacteroidota bacterium]